jgi:hypothetical protein
MTPLARLPLLRLVAGVILVVPATSCAGIVSDSAIEAYCNAGCGEPSSPSSVAGCVTTLEDAERAAEHASCGDAFLAFVRCEQQPQGLDDCGLGNACPDQRTGLVACVQASDPDTVCALGDRHIEDCSPGQGTGIPILCDGAQVCVSFCFLDATCDEIDAYAQAHGMEDDGLGRCVAACAFGPSLAPLEGD